MSTKSPSSKSPPVVPRRTLLLGLFGVLGIGGAALYRKSHPPHQQPSGTHQEGTEGDGESEGGEEGPKHTHSDSEAASKAQEAIAKEIASLPPIEKITRLLDYQQDKDDKKRYAVLELFTDLLSPQKNATPTLQHALETGLHDSHAAVRLHAVELAGNLPLKEALILLNAALHDEDTWVKQSAFPEVALLRQHQPSALYQNLVPTLIAALDDPDATIATSATHLLARTTGKKTWQYRQGDVESVKQKIHAQWRTWAKENPVTILPEFAQAAPLLPTREEAVPDFSLVDIKGQTVTNATLRGRTVLINFWGTWCGPCQGELPDLQRLHTELDASKTLILGVALDEESADSVQAFCQKKGLTYQQCLATDDFLKVWGEVPGVPVTVLLNPQGKLCRHWAGGRDYATFASAIKNVQAAH
jgi:peroxiredoxin